MARRFGSAMISNTDSTPAIYVAQYMRVKEYNCRPGSPPARNVSDDAFPCAGLKPESLRPPRYSSRSACIGSTVAARAAGISDAAIDTAITSATTPVIVIASQGDTPNSIPASAFVNESASPSPAAQPASETRRPCPRN